MGYSLKWNMYYESKTSKTLQPTIETIKEEFYKDTPAVIAFDTETTGLNITVDKPFLIVVAWKVLNSNIGKSFVIEWDKEVVKELYELAKQCKFIVGANIKYDLHMFRNGEAPFPFEILNEDCILTDIFTLRRLTMEADPMKQDEFISLKRLSAKFIDPNAKQNDNNITTLLHKTNLIHRKDIQSKLTPLKYKLANVEKIIEDCRYGIETLPKEVQDIYNNWIGPATYKHVYDRYPEDMNRYACFDGVFTIEVFLYLYSAYIELNNDTRNTLSNVFNQENRLIELYYNQEAAGIKVDLDYLKNSRNKLAQYIKSLEKELHTICGQEVSENQHKVLMNILRKFNAPDELFLNKDNKMCLDKTTLTRLLKFTDTRVIRIATLVSTLRRCRKWASTYVDGVYKEVIKNNDGRLHPSSNPSGTVSGRISGTMQQVPKDALVDLEGNEIFHPRKMITPSGDGYDYLVLQDFDAMELRVQAHYTINYQCTDENMCKLFIPLGYRHYQTGAFYNIDNDKDIAYDKQPNGDSVWVDVNNQPWIPTDPHGMHVESAFGLTKEHKNFKHLRSCAKTVNFAVNYGSGLNGLLENPSLEDYPAEVITKIFNAYKENFKGITMYQRIVQDKVRRTLQVSNTYGRVYRVNNNKFSYKCANYLIQGTCADLVKRCLIEIDNLFKLNNIKSRMLYTIHDEIMWELHSSEGWLIPMVEDILNKTASWCKIPLTSGTDLTTTNWAEKKDIKEFIGE